jgi:hypothetical protein
MPVRTKTRIFALTLAFAAAAAGPALAQQATAPQADAEVAAASAKLGEWGFTDLRFDGRDDGRLEFDAVTTDGKRVEIEIATDGTLHSLDVEGNGVSAALLAVLPEAVRTEAQRAGFAGIDEYELDDDGHELEGETGDGAPIEIKLPR